MNDISKYTFVIFGHEKVFQNTLEKTNTHIDYLLADSVNSINQPGIYLVASKNEPDFLPEKCSTDSGQASLSYLNQAIDFAKAGNAGAIVTGPVSKSLIKTPGKDFSGQTELLAEAFGIKHVTMMMACDEIKASLVTTHVPIKDLCPYITEENICYAIDNTIVAMKKYFGNSNPTIGVLGLNPHAGDDGLCGREDIEIITPVIAKYKAKGINTIGPLPADTAYRQALHGKYDAIIAMYHDQALIPVKTIAFEKTVNATLGLPILRTSPDHGPAYDIAGQYIADFRSMKAALELAIKSLK